MRILPLVVSVVVIAALAIVAYILATGQDAADPDPVVNPFAEENTYTNPFEENAVEDEYENPFEAL